MVSREAHYGRHVGDGKHGCTTSPYRAERGRLSFGSSSWPCLFAITFVLLFGCHAARPSPGEEALSTPEKCPADSRIASQARAGLQELPSADVESVEESAGLVSSSKEANDSDDAADEAPSTAPRDGKAKPEGKAVDADWLAQRPASECPFGGRDRPIALPPRGTKLGVTRLEPVPLADGMDNDAPAVAATGEGLVVVAFVSRASDDTETVIVRDLESPLAEPREPRPASSGARAWNPVLAAGQDGAVWLSWCGREEADAPGDHERAVYLRRVWPEPMSDIVLVSKGSNRHCDPAMDVAPDGRVHLVWEAGDRIAWRAYSAGGEPLTAAELISEGPFDRRPAVLANEGVVHVAWDRLDPTVEPGALDPRYDVLMRSRQEPETPNGDSPWGAIVEVDARGSIQAAPALARAPDNSGVLVAYHSSCRHPLTKWWRIRLVEEDGTVRELGLFDAAGGRTPEGEQQGAEFPALVAGSDGRLAIVTRPSQGAYLHIVDSDGVRPPLDLTRHGWGARGARARATMAGDGTLLMVRRARHEAVLERFTFEQPGSGPPPFAPIGAVPDEELPFNAAWRQAAGKTRPVDPDVLGPDSPNRRIALGDVHMHSALSDGTGPADEVYARARVRGMDFAVLTDHDYIVGSRMFPSKHAEIAWVTDWFDKLDGFATLHGFEWTTPPIPRGAGHRNVYYRGDPMMPQPGSRDGYPDTASLNRVLGSQRALSAAHHTAWTGTDWENLDPSVQRHVEIVSVHGAFERKAMDDAPISPRGDHEDGLIVHGLSRGHVFGFLGGSDSHGLLWHHGLGRRKDPWDQGLTGVVVHELSRAAIWDAMHARLTYATSGAPMLLQVSVSGVVMGKEGRIGGSPHSQRERLRVEGPPIVRWSYATTTTPRYLMVIRDGEPVHREELEEGSGSGFWRDESDLSVRHVYYVRLVQGEGEAGVDVAWSSPVFVEMRSQ